MRTVYEKINPGIALLLVHWLHLKITGNFPLNKKYISFFADASIHLYVFICPGLLFVSWQPLVNVISSQGNALPEDFTPLFPIG